MCILKAEGDYPENITLIEIMNGFNNAKNIKPIISKILIGEAPPPNYVNYFYNINSSWNIKDGIPSKGQAWTSSIKNALFPNEIFLTKIDFLKKCAKNGFLLLDLFSFNINYSGKRSNKGYKLSCIDGFCNYPNNVLNKLNLIELFICNKFSIGFAMKSFGEIILQDENCLSQFNNWLVSNGLSIIPPGTLNLYREIQVDGASNYVRVCYKGGSNGGGPMAPSSILMNLSGIGPCL
jgi:hypothetical protein